MQSRTGFQPVSPEQAGCLCHFLRFKGSEHLRNPDVNRSHEPQLVGCGVLTAPRPGGLGTARPTLRFMGSPLGFATAHWDHERWGETPSSPDLPATGIS